MSEWSQVNFKPEQLTFKQTIGRLFWNPEWNEYLYLMTCAERLVETPDFHWVEEINTRLAKRIELPVGSTLQFRLVFVERSGEAVAPSVSYVSTPLPMAENSA